MSLVNNDQLELAGIKLLQPFNIVECLVCAYRTVDKLDSSDRTGSVAHTSAVPLAILLPCSTSILYPGPSILLAAPSA